MAAVDGSGTGINAVNASSAPTTDSENEVEKAGNSPPQAQFGDQTSRLPRTKIITVSIASHLKIFITRNISRRLPLLESTRETSITKCDWKDPDVNWLYSLLYNMLFTQFYGLTYLSDLSCMRHCRLRSSH